ncbi:MAG: FAD-dependent oxidoreductase [Myxococcota bacterium]
MRKGRTGEGGRVQSSLFSWRDKRSLGGLFAKIARGIGVDGMTVAEWFDAHRVSTPNRSLIAMLVRLTSYADAPTRFCARTAFRQLHGGIIGGVEYLDRGWQQLVDQLAAAARSAGVVISTRTTIDALTVRAGAPPTAGPHVVTGVKTRDGHTIRARAVVLAAGAPAAERLLSPWPSLCPSVARYLGQRVPARVACFDAILRDDLTRRSSSLVLGFDEPLYVSVHSDTAQLAPPGHAVVHAMRYLAPGTAIDALTIRRQLETTLHHLFPRPEIVRAVFRPNMTAMSDIPASTPEGRRPAPLLAPGLFGVGDWVAAGDDSILAEASFASARAVATQLAPDCSEKGRAA